MNNVRFHSEPLNLVLPKALLIPSESVAKVARVAAQTFLMCVILISAFSCKPMYAACIISCAMLSFICAFVNGIMAGFRLQNLDATLFSFEVAETDEPTATPGTQEIIMQDFPDDAVEVEQLEEVN